MWDTFRTDAEGGMVAGVSWITGGGGDQIHAYIARPDGPGPHPGVVLVHHAPGWDEFYRVFSRRFAEHGFIAICPNLYERYGHGTPDDVAARVRGDGGVADDTPNLNAPLLGLFGNDDQSPSPAQVDQHEAVLRQNGKTYVFYRYDGAGHGFFVCVQSTVV